MKKISIKKNNNFQITTNTIEFKGILLGGHCSIERTKRMNLLIHSYPPMDYLPKMSSIYNTPKMSSIYNTQSVSSHPIVPTKRKQFVILLNKCSNSNPQPTIHIPTIY
jgi:hypothetical protein